MMGLAFGATSSSILSAGASGFVGTGACGCDAVEIQSSGEGVVGGPA
jgi:hypothetical protein